MSSPPHTVIAPHRLVRKLGEGGIGEVYEALHETHVRQVAIQLLRPQYARNTVAPPAQPPEEKPPMRRESHASSSLISRVILGSFLVCFAVLAHAQTSASSDSNDEALLTACEQSLACSSHLNRANQLYKQSMYSAALQEYQAAYVLQPYPPILYNIARLYHRQSQLSEAIAYYQRYLATSHGQQADRSRQLLLEAQQKLAAEKALRDSEPAPAELVPVVLPAITPSPPPTVRLHGKPIYQRWWFWMLTGVAATGIATAVELGVYAIGPDVSGRPAKTASFGN